VCGFPWAPAPHSAGATSFAMLAGTHPPMVHHKTPSSRRCIAVVGMNASGKSRFGRKLAEALGMPLIDTDDAFEHLHGNIHVFIDRHGWDAFRSVEEEVVEASLLPGHVVVLGGGAVESPVVRKALKQRARVLWIQAGHKRIQRNLEAARVRRPEFKHGHHRGAVKSLAEARHPLYAEVADIALYPHLRFSEQVPMALKLLGKKGTRGHPKPS